MNFVILSQYYPPEIGAPQARLSDLAGHFVARGHDVTVLTAMPNYPAGRIHGGYGGLVRREQRDGVTVIRTGIYPTQRAALIPRIMNYLSFAATAAALGTLRLRRSHYLLVESPPLFLGPTAYWLSLLKRARLIFNVSDLWPESAVHVGVLGRSSLAFRASAALEAFCYRKAWLVTGQSRTILSDIVSRFPWCPTFHLSNGVDTRRFSGEHATASARALLTAGAETVAVYAGLHGLAQGLDQILAAAEQLSGDAGFRFVLVGDGPEKQALVAEAAARGLRNVLFLDPRPNREMPALLASADIAIVTLKMDIPGAVPSKIYEAMASGLPLVLVASGEAADIVRTHDVGLVVPPGDIAALVAALGTLRSDPARARAIGERGRQAAQRYFDRAAIAARFIDHLERALLSPRDSV